MSRSNSKIEYTSAPLKQTMIRTTLAMLPATLAMSGYNITDTFFVGRLGQTEPLAAMGYTFPVIMFYSSIFFGLGSGSTANLSHALGRKDSVQAQTFVGSSIILISLTAIIMSTLGILYGSKIYMRLGAQGETLKQVHAYMDIWFTGSIAAVLAREGGKILIASGTPKLSSTMTVIGMLINVALDPIFIFGWGFIPGMGIKGAAIATVISQVIVTVVILITLKRQELLALSILTPARVWRSWGAIIPYAIPATLGMLLVPIANSIITKITAEFGDVAVAGASAASRLEMVAFVIPMALGITLLPMMAQNFGAGLYHRVRECLRMALSFAFIYLFIVGLVYVFAAPLLAPIFTPEKQVQAVMITYLRIVPLGLCMVECMRFSGFALTACARPKIDALLKALRIVCLHIPLSLLALYMHSLPGVFFARLISDVLGGLIVMFVAWRMLNKLTRENQSAEQSG